MDTDTHTHMHTYARTHTHTHTHTYTHTHTNTHTYTHTHTHKHTHPHRISPVVNEYGSKGNALLLHITLCHFAALIWPTNYLWHVTGNSE